MKVYTTKEPTDTKFGLFVKNNEEKLKGKSYAHLIVADRCYHIDNFILPQLVTNDIVICDRYIESSLVLQYYDGVDLQYIWKLNSEFPIPEISITFIADSSILEKRLSERNELTRFEKEISRTEEIELYKKANQFIKSKGFNGHLLYNNNEDDLSRNINTVLNLIENLKEMK